MINVGNSATTEAGGPIDHVHVFHWSTGVLETTTVPGSNGGWSVDIPAGTYGFTYIGSGVAPQTHGPYIIEEDEP